MAVKNAIAKTWAIAPSVGGWRWSTYPAGDKPASGEPPVLTADPVLAAWQPRVGVLHTYSPGTWTGAASVTAQWTLDGVPVLDAIASPTYTPATGDVGKRLGVLETATSSGGVADTASTQVKLVTPA